MQNWSVYFFEPLQDSISNSPPTGHFSFLLADSIKLVYVANVWGPSPFQGRLFDRPEKSQDDDDGEVDMQPCVSAPLAYATSFRLRLVGRLIKKVMHPVLDLRQPGCSWHPWST